MAQRIIDAVNENLPETDRISLKDTFIVRLVALLHDFGNLPFGHTLEDEGHLFEKQWQSETRQQLLLAPVSSIIERSIKEAFGACHQKDQGERAARDVLAKVKTTLVKEEIGDVDELDYAYIPDIVGNTICADLLDYLRRDAYFAGLSGQYDERVLSYFTLADIDNGKGQLRKRLVIQLFKRKRGRKRYDDPRRDEIRPDALSALVDMLRLRYSLAEKIYYHHAKREASAMIIKMVASGIKAGILDEKLLCTLDDGSLLDYVERYRTNATDATKLRHLQISQELAKRLRSRDLYKPAYELKIVEAKSREKVNELMVDWQKRYDFEESLANLVNENPLDIIVYIPTQEMGAKAAKTLVQLPFGNGSSFCSLENLATRRELPAEYRDIRDIVDRELRVLDTKHRMLWKLSVFVHQGVERTSLIKKVCEEWFQSAEQYALVDIKASAASKSLSNKEKMEIAMLARTTVSTPPSGSEHRCSFSRLLDVVDSLLGSRAK